MIFRSTVLVALLSCGPAAAQAPTLASASLADTDDEISVRLFRAR